MSAPGVSSEPTAARPLAAAAGLPPSIVSGRLPAEPAPWSPQDEACNRAFRRERRTDRTAPARRDVIIASGLGRGTAIAGGLSRQPGSCGRSRGGFLSQSKAAATW